MRHHDFNEEEEEKEEEEEEYHEYPREVKFRLGLTTVYGVAELFDPIYPHVMRLSILPRPWHRLVRCIVSWLPLVVRNAVKKYVPGPFLPAQVAVKKLQKNRESHIRLFDNEHKMYCRLQPLQGKIIPFFYGEGTCEGKRALVLSVIDGVIAMEQEIPRLSVEEFRSKIKVAADAMKPYGVVYGDAKLDNVLIVGDRVMFVDLEWASKPEDKLASRVDLVPASFATKYNQYLRAVGDEHAQARNFFF